MSNVKYVHKDLEHNLKSPKEIVPVLMDCFKPKSVVDFGCGIGTFVKVFKENGVNDVLGIDGEWVDKNKLQENISLEEFKTQHLDVPFSLNKKFDLAISLEVGEHLAENKAEIFIENITNASDTVVFSASLPLQGGQNHLNEQWLPYWIEKFEKRGYKFYDFLRPVFWDSENVFWWYAQNMVVFSKTELNVDLPNMPVLNVIHPKLFSNKATKLDDILNLRISNIFKHAQRKYTE